MEKGQKFKAKEDLLPLYKKGDSFRVIKLNEDPDLVPIEAVRLKDAEIYGFYPEEVENGKSL